MAKTIKAKFLGLHGDNKNFGIFDEVFPNAYDGCFMCDEVLKGMIKGDKEMSKLVVFEGEKNFTWSEKPIEGDLSRNKTLQEDLAAMEIAYKRAVVEKENAQKALEPLQTQVTALQGDLAIVKGEKEQLQSEVTRLQKELKDAKK